MKLHSVLGTQFAFRESAFTLSEAFCFIPSLLLTSICDTYLRFLRHDIQEFLALLFVNDPTVKAVGRDF